MGPRISVPGSDRRPSEEDGLSDPTGPCRLQDQDQDQHGPQNLSVPANTRCDPAGGRHAGYRGNLELTCSR